MMDSFDFVFVFRHNSWNIEAQNVVGAAPTYMAMLLNKEALLLRELIMQMLVPLLCNLMIK